MSRDQDDGGEAPAPASSFRFFRAHTPTTMRTAGERGAVRVDHASYPVTIQGLERFAAKAGSGATARVLYSSDEMHVAYVWFKSGFPLPLHSHDADCFYQIIAGSMYVGTEELRQGDGVLIPSATPYTVTPGADGVEFIEVRPTHDYDTRYRGRTEAYWDKIVAKLASREQAWSSEAPPFGLFDLHDQNVMDQP